VRIVTRSDDSEPLRERPRLMAVLTLAAFLAVLPTTSIMNGAEAITLADWLRQIFVTVDRKLDDTALALAAATPPPPPVALQTSSEQTPPKPALDRNRIPDGWLRPPTRRGRRRRRARR
jgi:hypothetical protein